MGFISIRMVMYLRESGKWGRGMGGESLKGLMGCYKLGIGVMINFKFDFCVVVSL
jgi:hypothetical protein